MGSSLSNASADSRADRIPRAGDQPRRASARWRLASRLDLVYQHRQVASRLERGRPVAMDEHARMAALEAGFAPLLRGPDDTRRFHRARVAARATLRVQGWNHDVEVSDLSLGGAACRRAPEFAPGTRAELVVEVPDFGSAPGLVSEPRQRASYHFKARVVWQRNDSEGCTLGLEFVGSPLVLHHFSQPRPRPRRRRA